MSKVSIMTQSKATPRHSSASVSGGSTDSGCGRECRRERRAVTAEVVVPPDGGWGWVVVVAAFLCNMTTDGVLFSFGTMLPHMAGGFDVAESRVAVIGSLMQGVFLMTGPLAGVAVGLCGLRAVAVAGGLLSAAGYLASYFVTSLPVMYLTHGVLIGIGFGFIYMTSLISVGFYFEKWRALATGIVTCGSGVGVVIFGPLETYLIKKVGWRNVLLFEAALTSLCVLYGACFRPLKPVPVATASTIDLDSESEPLKLALAETDQEEPEELNCDTEKKTNKDASYESGLDSNYNSMSSVGRQCRTLQTRRMTDPDLIPFRLKEHPGIFFSKENLMHEKRLALQRRHKCGADPSYTDLSMPLCRKDILYSGNLMKLPEYTSQASVLQGRMRTYSKSDVMRKGVRSEGVCFCAEKPAVKTSLVMLHVGILRSPSFLLYSLHGLFVMLGFLTPYLLSGPRARASGMSEQLAVWLVSSIGIANTCGKIVFGSLISCTGVDTVMTSTMALLLGAAALACSGLFSAVWFQFACNVLYGLSIGCFSSMKTVLLAELLGLDKLTNAFGLFLVFLGVGSLMGPPFSAWLREVFQDFNLPFYIVGSCLAISSLLMFSLKFVNRWEKNRTIVKKPSYV